MKYIWKQIKIALMILFFPITIILWLSGVFDAPEAEAKARSKHDENYFTEVIGQELNLDTQCSVKVNGRRYQPDICGKSVVYEVEWGGKDYEAIGQALTYAFIFKKKAGIIFLVSKESEMRRVKTALPVLKALKIESMIYEVDKDKGTYRMVG